jgi:TRAP-type mannitol/chloroaromatic compound transport system substrate-binding protein
VNQHKTCPNCNADLEAENARLKKEIEILLETAKDVGSLQLKNKILQRDLEQFQMALAEQVELNKNIVAAAYRAAAEICAKHEDVTWDLAMDEIYALTPADAEKALREFGMEILNTVYKDPCLVKSFAEIIDEVMNK